MGPAQIWLALVEAGKQCLFVAALVGAVGVLIGVLSLTGIVIRFPYVLVDLAGNSVLLTIGLIAVRDVRPGLAAADHGDLFNRRRRRRTRAIETRRAGPFRPSDHFLARARFEHHAAGRDGPLRRGGDRGGGSDENGVELLQVCESHLRDARAFRIHSYSPHRHTGAKYRGDCLRNTRYRALFNRQHRLLLRAHEFDRVAALSRRNSFGVYPFCNDRNRRRSSFCRRLFVAAEKGRRRGQAQRRIHPLT